MTNTIPLGDLTFKRHGICGAVKGGWDVGGGVTIPPCHGNELIAIDDHKHRNSQGKRRMAPSSGPTEGGLTYQDPIDCRGLFFDDSDGERRTYGMEGACVDLQVDLSAGQTIVFSWRFLSFSRGSSLANNFAMVLAYDATDIDGANNRPAPVTPERAPKLEERNSKAPTDLLQGAVRIPENVPTEFLNRRHITTLGGSDTHTWLTTKWEDVPSVGFSGVIRWLVCTGWKPEKSDKPGTLRQPSTHRDDFDTQRAFPPTLLLDCVEIVTNNENP